MTRAEKLLKSESFRTASGALLEAIGSAQRTVGSIQAASSPELRARFLDTLSRFQKNRGRDLYFPYLSSGFGSGPFVELEDGSVKLDLITGIGIQFFGHAHPELMREQIAALTSDPYQGNLQSGNEAAAYLDAVLSRVKDSRLKHGWLTTCGTMANENALKIVRKKKFPATKILAFQDCFAGRSAAMAEITDNPSYRQNMPVYGEVAHLSFYDESLGLEGSCERTLSELRSHLTRYGDKFAALMIEPVQGEGGFRVAPREWYERVFAEVKKAGILIWLDEIQTFGRTGELFAFQKLGLSEYVDIVTFAKMAQVSAVLYTEALSPEGALLGGTFTGTSATLRVGRRVLELLDEGKFFGSEGRIERLSRYFVSKLDGLARGSCKGLMGERRAYGGMIGFVPLSGSSDDTKRVIMKLFDLGVVVFYCGHGPYLIRMLPPLGAMDESHIDVAVQKIEQALLEVGSA